MVKLQQKDAGIGSDSSVWLDSHSSVSSHLSLKFGRNNEYEVGDCIDEQYDEENALSKKLIARKLIRVNLQSVIRKRRKLSGGLL